MIIDTNFQTPVPVCDYMASLIPEHTMSVFEPTPGIGNLVQSTIEAGFFNIETAEDFFLHDKSKRYDTIIMNPPFSGKSQSRKR